MAKLLLCETLKERMVRTLFFGALQMHFRGVHLQQLLTTYCFYHFHPTSLAFVRTRHVHFCGHLLRFYAFPLFAANPEEALAQALNLAVIRMSSRLEVMENTAAEMVERAQQLTVLAESLEGPAAAPVDTSPKKVQLRKASAVMANTEGISWKKYDGLTNVDHSVPASPEN